VLRKVALMKDQVTGEPSTAASIFSEVQL